MPYDGAVVIAGAGPAGIATALSAARSGCRVLLLEKRQPVGGTVTGSLIHTLGGFYDDAGNALNQGLSVELCHRLLEADKQVTKRKIGRTWCLAADPALFGQVLSRWINEESNITLAPSSTVVGGTICDNAPGSLDILLRGELVTVHPAAAVDATGNAELVQLLSPDSVLQDERRAFAGLIFRLRCCEPGALTFPKGVELLRAIRQAVTDGELSPIAGSAWLDRGLSEDEIFVKLSLPPENSGEALDPGCLTDAALQARDSLLVFLMRYSAFRRAICVETGLTGIRDGGRIRGNVCLSESDLLSCRKYPDAACEGSWPLEYWDQEQGVSLRHLPAGGHYDIPLGCLQVAGVDRLWAAGKCLSATPQARASARVVGCCWAMGDAVGKSVANCVKQGGYI